MTSPLPESVPLSHPRRPRLDALTGIRFFAAMHVLVYHAYRSNIVQALDHWKSNAPHFPMLVRLTAGVIDGVVSNGGASVGLFFILSGFILAYTYLDGRGNLTGTPSGFFINRFARVYPTYLLGFLIATPLELHRRLGETALLIKTAILNLALLQAWWPAIATNWNAPGWSLSDEAFFYASFPLLAVALMRHRGSKDTTGAVAAIPTDRVKVTVIAIITLLVIMMLGALRSLIAGDHLVGIDDPAGGYFNFMPILRLPEFVLGIAAGRWFFLHHAEVSARPPTYSGRGGQSPAWRWIAPLAVVAAALVLGLPMKHAIMAVRPAALSLLFMLLISALAVDGWDTPGWFTRLLGIRPLILLGEASYAIYIIHVPVIHWIDRIPARTWTALSHATHVPSLKLLSYPVVVIIAAVLIFWFFENPSRRWVRARLEGLMPGSATRAAKPKPAA